MEKQQSRKLQLLKLTQEIMDGRSEVNYHHLYKMWPLQKKALLQSIERSFQEIINYQRENTNYSITYLQCSLLRSSFITESFQYLISAFSREYYLDESAFHLNWDATPFFQFLDSDMETISTQLSLKFQRLQEYELKDLRYRVCYYYDVIVGTFFATMVPDIVSMPDFRKLNKTSDFCILLSGWLDKSVKLYPLDRKEGEM